MTRGLRKVVVTSAGKHYSGRWPQQMPSTGEGPYISALALSVGGACEVVLPVGRADVANSSTIFEVEPAPRWRTGLRQVLAYAGQTGQRPALALFGPVDYLKVYLFVRDRIPGCELWAYRSRWIHITNRQLASIKHHPRYDTPPAVGEFGSLPLPRLHPFDSSVPASVVDPWERAKRAELFRRAEEASVDYRRSRVREGSA